MKVIIEGMMCLHCAGRVKDALEKVSGVKEVEVNLKKKCALISGEVSKDDIISAVENAGYKVKKIADK